MSLFVLRQKIFDRIKSWEDNTAECEATVIYELDRVSAWVESEISIIESRLLELEKETDESGFNIRGNENPLAWHRRHGELDALKRVLGEKL